MKIGFSCNFKNAKKSTSHSTYIHENGDMMKLLRDFYTSVLSQKPDDVYQYAAKYFDSYAP